jgi:hypothetical protein
MKISDWVGFTGVAILLIAFLLNLLNKATVNSYAYISLNLVGAALACAASVLISYTPFIILEGAWTLVSFISLVRLAMERKTS